MNLINVVAIAAMLPLGTIATAQAADLSTVKADTGIDWTGGYIGASAGYGEGTLTRYYVPLDIPFYDDFDGWLAGLQGGYNFQNGSFVLGVEGNVSWTNLSTTSSDVTLPYTVDWMASPRGRLGFTIEGVLLYGTAGVAVANATSYVDEVVDNLHYGWVAGAGIEAMVTDNVSARFEYAYSSFDSQRYDFTDPVPISIDGSFDTQVVTAGVNMHF